MKSVSFLVLAASLALSAGPALAATPAAPTGNVPYCSSNSTQLNLNNGVYAQQLQQPGKSLDSLDVWNGCLKAIYTDGHGHTTTAFYDPDSLKLLDTLGSPSVG